MPVLDLATVLMSGRPWGACVRLEVEWKRFLETFLETFLRHERAGRWAAARGRRPAPAERRRWRLCRLVLRSVPRVRACACAACAPALCASAAFAPAACMPAAPVRRASLAVREPVAGLCVRARAVADVSRTVAGQGMAARACTDQGVPEGFVLQSLGPGAPWLVLHMGEFCQLRPVAQCAPAETGAGGRGSWPLYGVDGIMKQRQVKSVRPNRIVESAKACGVRFYPAVDDRAREAALVDIMGVLWLASHLGMGEPRYRELGGAYVGEGAGGASACFQHVEDPLERGAMHQEAAAQHRSEASTLFGLAAAGGRTKEEMRETLQKLAPSLGTRELDDLERAFGEGQHLQHAMTLPAPGKQPVQLSARERKLVLRHLRAMIKNDEGDRQLIAEIMARDPALLVHALDSQDGDGVRESIKSKLIAEVRPVLELLTVRALLSWL